MLFVQIFFRIKRNSVTKVIGVRIYQGLGARCRLVSFPHQLGIFVPIAYFPVFGTVSLSWFRSSNFLIQGMVNIGREKRFFPMQCLCPACFAHGFIFHDRQIYSAHFPPLIFALGRLHGYGVLGVELHVRPAFWVSRELMPWLV